VEAEDALEIENNLGESGVRLF